MLIKTIRVLVCPTPECDNYYGAPAMEAVILGRANSGRGINGETIGPPTPRSNCPSCRELRGLEVPRVLFHFSAEVPVVVDATAEEILPSFFT